MHRLLKHHHKTFDIAKVKPLPGGEGVTVAMAKSFDVIFDAFTRRTRSLMESWRQQRIGNDLQAEWYANGYVFAINLVVRHLTHYIHSLFEDWYKRVSCRPTFSLRSYLPRGRKKKNLNRTNMMTMTTCRTNMTPTQTRRRGWKSMLTAHQRLLEAWRVIQWKKPGM